MESHQSTPEHTRTPARRDPAHTGECVQQLCRVCRDEDVHRMRRKDEPNDAVQGTLYSCTLYHGS